MIYRVIYGRVCQFIIIMCCVWISLEYLCLPEASYQESVAYLVSTFVLQQELTGWTSADNLVLTFNWWCIIYSRSAAVLHLEKAWHEVSLQQISRSDAISRDSVQLSQRSLLRCSWMEDTEEREDETRCNLCDVTSETQKECRLKEKVSPKCNRGFFCESYLHIKA